MGYKKHFIKSVGWVGTLRLLTRGIVFLRLAVLARLLSPFQFGLIGIATLVLSLIEIVTETGINVFLVQEEKSVDKYIDTAWIVSILRGFIICFVITIGAYFIAMFFSSPQAIGLILLIGIVPVIRGFINPSVLILQKELKFDKEFYFQGTLSLIDAVSTLTIAYITKSAYSIVFGMIISATIEVIISFIFITPRPRFSVNFNYIKRVLNNGKWITAAGIFNYLYHNFDNIVVGRVLGVHALGLYGMGYKISSLPITEISEVSSRVTFPLYSKIGGDLRRLKNALIRVMSIIAFLSFVLGGLLFLFTNEFVLIMLGSKWMETVPVIRVLVFYGILQGIFGSLCALFLAVKKQKYVTVVTGANMLGVGVTIIPFVKEFGILGAGYSAVVGSVVALPFFVYFLFVIFSKKNKS